MGQEGSLLVNRNPSPPHFPPHTHPLHLPLLLPKGQTLGHCLEAEDLIFEVSLTQAS